MLLFLMQFVEPIRDAKKISQIKNQLRGGGKIRDLLLFELGINSALRISDLLSVTVGDVYDEGGQMKDFFYSRDGKTKKGNKITITPNVRKTLEVYYQTYPFIVSNRDHYLFFNSRSTSKGDKPLSRKQGWMLIRDRCKSVGLQGNYGGHTLRKTRGYHARKNNVPDNIIQQTLQHSSFSMTLKYLGITYDEIAEARNNLDL